MVFLLKDYLSFTAHVIALEGRRHKGWQEEKSDFARRRERGEGGLTPIEPTQGPTNEDQKDKLPHHNKNFEDHEKHKWNKDGKEHHKGYKHHDHSFKGNLGNYYETLIIQSTRTQIPLVQPQHNYLFCGAQFAS